MNTIERKDENMAIKIFIDQGHNPSLINAGANVNGIQEANITYVVGTFLAELLNNDPRFEVKVSRENEDSVLGTTIRESLQERVQMANEWDADYFISIHANANNNANINGSEVYLYQENEETRELSQDILNGLKDVVDMKDNGIRLNPSLYVLRNTKMPALLIELGYLTNETDFNKLVSEPEAFSQAIYIGINTYFS